MLSLFVLIMLFYYQPPAWVWLVALLCWLISEKD